MGHEMVPVFTPTPTVSRLEQNKSPAEFFILKGLPAFTYSCVPLFLLILNKSHYLCRLKNMTNIESYIPLDKRPDPKLKLPDGSQLNNFRGGEKTAYTPRALQMFPFASVYTMQKPK